MSVDSALPSVEHLLVVVLFGLNASLVFQLGQLRSSLLVHNLLEFASHGAVALANLSQHVGLVHLLHHASLYHLVLVGLVLALNFGFHVVALVLLHPLLLLLQLFLKFDVLLPICVDVSQQVNAGLVLTVPLLLTGFPLLGVLLSNESIDHLLVSLFVLALLLGELLQLNSLGTVAHAFVVLKLLKSLLALKGGVQKLQVSLLLGELSLFSKELLLLVVLDEAKVTFTDEDLALFLAHSLTFGFGGPLGLEHVAFNCGLHFLLVNAGLFGLLLPVKYSKGISVELLLFFCLSDFALELLLGIERVQLSIDLLFKHALLDLAALIDELLLTLNLSSHNIEFRVFLAEGVVTHLELLIQLTLNEGLALLFTISLKRLKALVHALANLFGSLLLIIEFLFVHTVLSCEEHGELFTASFKVSGVLSAQICESTLDDLLLNDLVGLVFPLGSEGQVLVSSEVGSELLHFLNNQ